jgi:hypothetical protein
MQICPHDACVSLARRFEQVMMIVPVNAKMRPLKNSFERGVLKEV